MSDDNRIWVILAVVVVGLWFEQNYQEIIDFKNSVIDTTFLIINCVLYAIGGIALIFIGYYCAQRIHERY